MIPDKIYFPEDGLPSYIDWDGSPIRTKQVEDSDVCYISKDALVELAKSIQDKPYDGTTVSADEHLFAQWLIDKIENL